MFARFLALFLLFSGCDPAYAAPSPCWWQGSVVKCWPSAGMLLHDQRDLRLGEATSNGSNYAAFQAPSSLSADYTLTLPADDGTDGQVLTTNGTGTLTWGTNTESGSIQGTIDAGDGCTGTSNVNYYYVRQGQVVTLCTATAADHQCTSNSTAQPVISFSGGSLPAPTTAKDVPAQTVDNSTITAGAIRIDTGGTITVWQGTARGTTFTAANSKGLRAGCFSYTTN